MDDLERISWREKLAEVYEILEKEYSTRTRSEVIKLSQLLYFIPSLTNMCPRSELDTHLIELSQFLEMVPMKEGEFVFHKGEESTHFYFVLKGTLAVFIQKSMNELELEEKLRAQLKEWQISLERMESPKNNQLKKTQVKENFSRKTTFEDAQVIQAINQSVVAAELLENQLRSGKAALKEYSNLEDEQLLRGNSETKYFRGENGCLCIFKRVQTLSERESFGESVLSSSSQQRTGTVVACPGGEVVLVRIEKDHFLSVFTKELDKRQQIRRALYSSYKKDLNDKVLNTLTFQFREVHFQKNVYIATQGPLFSSEYITKVEDSPLTKKRSREQQYLAEKEEYLYFLYKGSLEVQVKSPVESEEAKEPESKKNLVQNDDYLLKNANNNFAKNKLAKQVSQLRLARLSEGEFFGHENWFKDDIEKLLKQHSSTKPSAGQSEQSFKDKVAQNQLYIDFSIMVAEIDTILFRIPKKYLLEEQNQFLFCSLVEHGRQRHNRYCYLEQQAIVKEQNKNMIFQQQQQQQQPTQEAGLAGIHSDQSEQYWIHQMELQNRKKLFTKLKADKQEKEDKVAAAQKAHFQSQFEAFRKKFDIQFNFSVSQFSHPINAVGTPLAAGSLYQNLIQKEKQIAQYKRTQKIDNFMAFSAAVQNGPMSESTANNQLESRSPRNSQQLKLSGINSVQNIDFSKLNQTPSNGKQTPIQAVSSLNNFDFEESSHKSSSSCLNTVKSSQEGNSPLISRGKSLHNLNQFAFDVHSPKKEGQMKSTLPLKNVNPNRRSLTPCKNRLELNFSSQQQLISQQPQSEIFVKKQLEQQQSQHQQVASTSQLSNPEIGNINNAQFSPVSKKSDLLKARKLHQQLKLTSLQMKKSTEQSAEEDMSPILIKSISKNTSNTFNDVAEKFSPTINRDSRVQKLSFPQLKSIINLNKVQAEESDGQDFAAWSQKELEFQKKSNDQVGLRQVSNKTRGQSPLRQSSPHYNNNDHMFNFQTPLQYDSTYQGQQLGGDENSDCQQQDSESNNDSSSQLKQKYIYEESKVKKITQNQQPISPTKSQIYSQLEKQTRSRIQYKFQSPPPPLSQQQQSLRRLHSQKETATTSSTTSTHANSSSPLKINKPQIQPSSQPISPPLKSNRYLFTRGDPSTLFHTFSYETPRQRQQSFSQQSPSPNKKVIQFNNGDYPTYSLTDRRSLSPAKIKRKYQSFQISQQDSCRSSSVKHIDAAAGSNDSCFSQVGFSAFTDGNNSRVSKNTNFSQDPRDSNIFLNINNLQQNQGMQKQQQQIQHIIHNCFKNR